jgi:DNA oxidative demethylase
VARREVRVGELAGFTYTDDFLDPATEKALLAYLSSLTLEPLVIRGNPSKRTSRHFGLRYNYRTRALRETDPIPAELRPPIEQAERLAGLAAGTIVEALVNRYPPGASVGWHNDADVYGTIIGVSLGSPCIIQFKSKAVGEPRLFERQLSPRSAYVMTGAARDDWQHRIPPTKAERFSLTFRSLLN